jgi:sulfate adenylyltransferase subunit 2
MPFKETEQADTQLTIYAATKKACESMAHAYAHLFSIPTTMLRFFSVYGPWGRPDLALFKFVDAILDDRPIDIYNHGDMERDFTYVTDLVRAIRLLLPVAPPGPESRESPIGGDSLSPVAPYRSVNIGKSEPTRLLDFIEIIERQLGKRAVRNSMDMQPGDVPATWADASLLRELTGYQPQTSLRRASANLSLGSGTIIANSSLHDSNCHHFSGNMHKLTHLDRLEAESIHIMRETVAEAGRPVMLYSIGKDSAVMLHVARKAFYPAPLPFPLLHVDTTWKFQAMYALRDKVAADPAVELIVHRNQEAESKGINPFDHGPIHTDMWKTEGLKQALDKHGFDAAFGGARRDEEKSRAKERIFSFRTANHRWDPKRQRPELWSLYNVRKNKGESVRVFPLSNWTELDVWQYILREKIEIVPLYFAAERPTVVRDGLILMVDDDRFPLEGEEPVAARCGSGPLAAIR